MTCSSLKYKLSKWEGEENSGAEVGGIRHHSKPAFILEQGLPKEKEDKLVEDLTENGLVPSRSKRCIHKPEG